VTLAVAALAAGAVWSPSRATASGTRTRHGRRVARWIGIGAAGVNAILQLLNLPSYPLLAITIFAVDVLVLYALVTFGGRHRAAV
jgi:hypothetical protein